MDSLENSAVYKMYSLN